MQLSEDLKRYSGVLSNNLSTMTVTRFGGTQPVLDRAFALSTTLPTPPNSLQNLDWRTYAKASSTSSLSQGWIYMNGSYSAVTSVKTQVRICSADVKPKVAWLLDFMLQCFQRYKMQQPFTYRSCTIAGQLRCVLVICSICCSRGRDCYSLPQHSGLSVYPGCSGLHVWYRCQPVLVSPTYFSARLM